MRVRTGAGGSPPGRAVDLVFLLRPLLLCVSAAFFFAGASRGLDSPAGALWLATRSAVVRNFFLFILIVASSFVINQIFDVESDRLNEKNFLLASGLVSRARAAVLCAVLSLAALIIAFGSQSPVRELGIAGLALGYAYSMPPLRLKGRPIADMLANGLGFGLLGYAFGRLSVLPYENALLLEAAPYTLAMCAIFLLTTICDEAGDRTAGDRTACVAMGRERVARAALVMLAAAAIAGMLMGAAIPVLAAAASLPAFIAVAVQPSFEMSVLASQFAGRAFFGVVCVAAPQLAVLGALAYWLSKAYYARRLGLDYPRIEGASAKARKLPHREEGCRSTPLRSGL